MLSLNFVYLLTILRIGYCMLAAAGDSLRAFVEIVIIRLAVILARAGRIRFWPECVISAVAFFLLRFEHCQSFCKNVTTIQMFFFTESQPVKSTWPLFLV